MTKVEPFGQEGVYQLTPVFGHTSFPAFITDRDYEARSTTNASKTVANGQLIIETSATSGNVYRYETARFCPYQSGTSTVASIGLQDATLPTGDGALRAGIGYQDGSNNDQNSAHFEWRSNNLVDCVVVTAGVERWRKTISLEGIGGPSTKPTDVGVIPGIEYIWYAVGPVWFKLWEVDEDGQFNEYTVATWYPGKDDTAYQHFTTPNLPVFAEVRNETTSENVSTRIGGRRCAIRGKNQNIIRPVPEFRSGVSVADGSWTPLIAFRAKQTWGGVANNLVAAIENYSVLSTDNVLFGLFDLPNGTLTGTWDAPTFVPDDEQSLQVNLNPGNFSPIFARSRLSLASGGQANTAGSASAATPAERIQLTRDREMVLAAQGLGVSPTVDAVFSVDQEGR